MKKRHFKRKPVRKARAAAASLQADAVPSPAGSDIAADTAIGAIPSGIDVEAAPAGPGSPDGIRDAKAPDGLKFLPYKVTAGDHAIAARLRERSKAKCAPRNA